MRKVCSKCNIEKGVKSYYKRKGGKFGCHAECKECLINREKKYRNENPEKKAIRDMIYAEKLKTKFSDVKFPHNHIRLPERSMMGFERYAEKKMQNLAGNLLNYALRIKLIKKPESCTVCFKKDTLEGHHIDYSKPLEVAWVCKECHKKFHKKKEI